MQLLKEEEAGKGIHNVFSVWSENSATWDNCPASLGKLVMLNSNPRDGIFNTNLTTIKDYFIPSFQEMSWYPSPWTMLCRLTIPTWQTWSARTIRYRTHSRRSIQTKKTTRLFPLTRCLSLISQEHFQDRRTVQSQTNKQVELFLYIGMKFSLWCL